MAISQTQTNRLAVPDTISSAKVYKRMQSKMRRKSVRKRVIRFSLLGANVVILVAILLFVLQDSNKTNAVSVPGTTASATTINPLDQLASANVALTVARMNNLPETTAITNQDDSEQVNLTIAASINDTVASKPQVVSTQLKSKADIKNYVAVSGDTISSIANKFGVTSDSIRWSNGITGDTVAAGAKLVIPPVNGIVYTVKGGDTPDSLASKYGASKDQIVAYNDAEISGLQPGEQIIIPNGTVQAASSSSFSGSSSAGFAWGSSAVYGSNGYDPGWCTWYAASRRAELGRPIPSNLGNAYSWYRAAALAGLPTGSTPAVGAVMVNQAGDHVAVVEAVNADGSFWISEMNSHGQVSMTNTTPTGGLFVRDYKLVPSVGSLKFIY